MLTYLNPQTFRSVIDLSERAESPFANAVSEALRVIDSVLQEEREDAVAISFNGGKDCTVMLHLLAVCLWRQRLHKAPTATTSTSTQTASGCTPPPALPPIESSGNCTCANSISQFKGLYVTCSSPFPEVDTFVDSCAVLYDLDLVHTTPGGLPMKEALKQYKEREPGVKAILVGTRRDDPHGARLEFRAPTDEGWPSFLRVHPIINWTYGQIWEYLRTFGVPYCELYNQGYTSLGSTFNTFPNPALREDNGQYRPAYELKDGRKERYGRDSFPGTTRSVDA